MSLPEAHLPATTSTTSRTPASAAPSFTDITGNGFTADDTPLAGVTINLYENGGITPVATTTTAADGSYSFANLGPGSYSVQETVPAGSTQTGGNAGYTVSATSGTNSTGNNFDDFQNISISGTKYNDITGNSFSSDDTVLGGVTINLFENGGPHRSLQRPRLPMVVPALQTLVGSYSVQETVPAGSTQTGGNAGYTLAQRAARTPPAITSTTSRTLA